MIPIYTLAPDRSEIGRIAICQLLAEMELVRQQLIEFTKDLSRAELDMKILPSFNSIGTILKHIAANEFVYYLATFEGRTLNDHEKKFWKGALTGELIMNITNGNDIGYYHTLLTTIRSQSIKVLTGMDDEWLNQSTLYKFKSAVNNYYCWFHVMEDEISHFGQIKIFKNQIRQSKNS